MYKKHKIIKFLDLRKMNVLSVEIIVTKRKNEWISIFKHFKIHTKTKLQTVFDSV